MADEKNGNSPLAETLRIQIIELASKGDPKSGGALTPEVLAKIMRVAKAGRDLVVSLNASPANLAAMMKRHPGFGIPVLGEENMDSLPDLGGTGPIPLATSLPSENFGMTALREIIAGLKAANGSESPVRLVEALAAARTAGLDDVAKAFEKKLGIGKGEIEAKPATPAAKEGDQT